MYDFEAFKTQWIIMKKNDPLNIKEIKTDEALQVYGLVTS